MNPPYIESVPHAEEKMEHRSVFKTRNYKKKRSGGKHTRLGHAMFGPLWLHTDSLDSKFWRIKFETNRKIRLGLMKLCRATFALGYRDKK